MPKTIDKQYKSDLYYDVVICAGSYLGWTCPDVGLGSMRFIHPEHADFRVDKGDSPKWMKECWDDFIVHADTNI